MESTDEIMQQAGHLYGMRRSYKWSIKQDNAELSRIAPKYVEAATPEAKKKALENLLMINRNLLNGYVYHARTLKEAKDHYEAHEVVYQEIALAEAEADNHFIVGWSKEENPGEFYPLAQINSYSQYLVREHFDELVTGMEGQSSKLASSTFAAIVNPKQNIPGRQRPLQVSFDPAEVGLVVAHRRDIGICPTPPPYSFSSDFAIQVSSFLDFVEKVNNGQIGGMLGLGEARKAILNTLADQLHNQIGNAGIRQNS